MKKIHILYFNFVTKDNVIGIGGIETYIQLLVTALHPYYKLSIYFPTSEDYILNNDIYISYGIKCKNIIELQQIVMNDYLDTNDLLIFASDQIIPKINHPKIIGIQHGIYWDLPTNLYRKNINGISKGFFKLYDNYRNFIRTNKYYKIVCVDYNFLNWRRTLSPGMNESKFEVILNCASDPFFKLVPTNLYKRDITLLFPRRFVELRGCLLFAKISRNLIKKYSNLNIIITGEGPLENQMKDILTPNDRVKYIRTEYSEMPSIIKVSDIIIVPSLGSEGSSLSVIEGMAAGRLVIATNIGGITNLITNNFNGLLCSPTYDSINNLLEKVISNPTKFTEIPANARKTAESAFNFNKWSHQWIDFLNDI